MEPTGFPADTLSAGISVTHTVDAADSCPLPVDSAFTGGRLCMQQPSDAYYYTGSGTLKESFFNGGTIVSLAIILSTIACMANIRRLVNLIPSLAGCMVRWKESINLEDSAQLSRTRDRVWVVLIVPYCLIAAGYRLYSPDFLDNLPDSLYFLAVSAAAGIYLGLRRVTEWALKGRKAPAKTYATAAGAFRTFFIIISVTALLTAGIMKLADTPLHVAHDILLYETALLYMLFLLRKTQIFANSCSLISAILYLCALEFFPTGILIASATVL